MTHDQRANNLQKQLAKQSAKEASRLRHAPAPLILPKDQPRFFQRCPREVWTIGLLLLAVCAAIVFGGCVTVKVPACPVCPEVPRFVPGIYLNEAEEPTPSSGTYRLDPRNRYWFQENSRTPAGAK